MAKKRKKISRASRRTIKTARKSNHHRHATARQASPKSRSKAPTGSGRKTKAPRYVYYFSDGQADGTGKMKPLLGGKGANLAEMTRIGLPVPPGFTITTEVCS